MLVRRILLLTCLVVVMGTLAESATSYTFNPPSDPTAPTTVAVGSIIQCMADGTLNPPQIKWYDTYGDLVSGSSGLPVTENMRHWKQPITLHCWAFDDIWYPDVNGVYKFKVANASSDAAAAGEISFYPQSSAEAPATIAAGAIIQCMSKGISSPTIKWYDHKGNEMSGCGQLSVTENLRFWKQPITVYCRAFNDSIYPGVENAYIFQVAKASLEGVDDCHVVKTVFSPASGSDDQHAVAEVGTHVQVIINGIPEYAVRWYDKNWNEISVWGGLFVTEDMRNWEQPIMLHYKTYLRPWLKTSDGNFKFQVASNGVEAWVIAVAVVVPVVVIAAIAVAVFFIKRHQDRKMSTAKIEPTKSSTGAPSLQY